MKNYYKLPLSTSRILQNKEAETCTLEQSIFQFTHLLMTSYFGEYDYDESFGCEIWELDFNNLYSTKKLCHTISESLKKNLLVHEKRIRSVDITTNIVQDEFVGNNTHNRVKKRVDIKLVCRKTQTNETFTFNQCFYLAPFAPYKS